MRFIFFPGLLLFLTTVFLSCSSPSSIGSLDLEQWRSDKRGCTSQRIHMIDDLNSAKTELLGKSSNEIGRLFGRPDINQLGGRNLKIYIYFLEKGAHCEGKSDPANIEKAVFRFNAVGLLTEINIQSDMPE